MRKHPDERIIQLLIEGYHEKEIPYFLSSEGYWPKSLSYVEKFLKRLKERHGVKTMFSLGLNYGKRKSNSHGI